MVTQEKSNGRKLLTIAEAERIITESKTKKEMVKKLTTLPKRQPAPPPPPGGISLREASRRHGIPDRSIGRWVKQGLIPILKTTRNEVYIDGDYFAKLVKKYKAHTGSKRRSMRLISQSAS